jgi:ABC-2 type transport system permease protein
MTGNRLFTIAQKEFFDHIRSRKFLLIFGILLVVAIVGMIGGISEYNKTLDQYNKGQSAVSSDISGEMTEKPSILGVFSSVATYLVFVGGVLGIAMGFDLVSKEKESKSLKILLSHPVYRDEVINGKALGGIVALGCALGVVLFIALATLLVYGIVPDGNELVLIAVFGGVSFLLIFSYFAIALFMSTAMDESGSSLIYTIIIFIVLSVLVPTLANDTVMDNVIGSQPELPQELLDQMQISPNSTSTSTATVVVSSPVNTGNSDAWKKYNDRMQVYSEKRQMIHDTLALFSPTMNYEAITSSITYRTSNTEMIGRSTDSVTSFSTTKTASTGVENILGKIIANIIALLLFPAVFFGLAYMRFMRMDVR